MATASRPEAIVPAAQVINRLIELTKLFPKLQEMLPGDGSKAATWRKLFGTNDQTRRLMDILREAPAFTERAPRKGDLKAWTKLLSTGYGNQAEQLVRELLRASKENPLPRRKIKRWRDRFGPEEVIQRVRPKESDAWLPNPHRGTTTFQRFQGDDAWPLYFTSDTHGPVEFSPNARTKNNVKFVPRTTLTYVRWPWAWLEPEKGKFRWDIIDQSLLTAHNRGQTVQLRFQPYTSRVDYTVTPPTSKRHPPDRSVNVPDWYWDTGAAWVEQGVYAPNEPDSNDPLYLQHFGDFVRAFAARYDGHPDLESIDIAYAGFWGESGGNSTPDTGRKLAAIYLDAFRKTQLLGMLGSDGLKHAMALMAGGDRHMGWRADCFGDLKKTISPDVPLDLTFNHTHDAYPKEIELCGVKDGWQRAPVTMETCGNAAWWYLAGYDIERIISEGYKYHMSVFMPKSVFFPKAIRERLVEFDRYIGYRFVIRQLRMPLEATPGQAIDLEFYLDNVGCAPIYRPYPLAVRFRQGGVSKVVRMNVDIRKWLPGIHWFSEPVTVPAELAPGEAKVDIAIVDPENDRPRVWFAIEGKLDGGWHPMTSIDIK